MIGRQGRSFSESPYKPKQRYHWITRLEIEKLLDCRTGSIFCPAVTENTQNNTSDESEICRVRSGETNRHNQLRTVIKLAIQEKMLLYKSTISRT